MSEEELKEWVQENYFDIDPEKWNELDQETEVQARSEYQEDDEIVACEKHYPTHTFQVIEEDE